MVRSFKSVLLGAVSGLIFAGVAAAQEAPALKGLSGAEKQRVQTLIEGAKKEGAIAYVDAIIQPETNDALTEAFKKRYGLPASFKVNYQLLSTLSLITRVDQEIAAGRVSFDVAAVGSRSRRRGTSSPTTRPNTRITRRCSTAASAKRANSPSTVPTSSCRCGARIT